MNTANHLLPVGASQLEKRAAECLQEAVTNNIPIEDLIDAKKCPVNLLPYLAWAFSVDRWEEYWPENIKRKAIEDAFSLHQKKGTVSAVRKIVETLGYKFEIREWFNEKRERTAGTFRLFVELKDKGFSNEMYEELIRLIEDTKPVSRQMTELAIVSTQKGRINVFSAPQSGDITTIYPR